MFELMPRPWERRMSRFPQEMDSFLDRFLIPSPFGQRDQKDWWPVMNVVETKDKFTITAELPGLDSKDVKVSLEGGILSIQGEKKEEHEDKEGSYHRLERSYGSFSRSIRLPDNIDPDKIKAKYKDGVLTLTVPKTKESVGRQIEIKAD